MAVIGVIMGSQSDWETMRHGVEILEQLDIPHEVKIVSAHRTPDRLVEYAKGAEAKGLKVIIAGAGGAAHLPGMAASMTHLPVLGVPVESKFNNGLDSLLSIAQMPGGIPVGTLATGKAGAKNAALLAAVLLGCKTPQLQNVLKCIALRKPQPWPRSQRVNAQTFFDHWHHGRRTVGAHAGHGRCADGLPRAYLYARGEQPCFSGDEPCHGGML